MGDTLFTLAIVMAVVSMVSLLVSIVMRKYTKWCVVIFVICFALFFVLIIVGGNINKANSANSEPSTSEEVIVETSITEVSSEAEMILMMMAEDVAKQITNYPATVDFNTFEWGFWRNEHAYAVQGTFSCTNAFGVEEEYTLKLICEANSDYSQISAKEVYLNGELIKSEGD